MEYVNLTNAAVPDSDETRSQEQGQGGSVLYMPGPGEAGHGHQQYITIIQDGQTYAIPAADYAANELANLEFTLPPIDMSQFKKRQLMNAGLLLCVLKMGEE